MLQNGEPPMRERITFVHIGHVARRLGDVRCSLLTATLEADAHTSRRSSITLRTCSGTGTLCARGRAEERAAERSASQPELQGTDLHRTGAAAAAATAAAARQLTGQQEFLRCRRLTCVAGASAGSPSSTAPTGVKKSLAITSSRVSRRTDL